MSDNKQNEDKKIKVQSYKKLINFYKIIFEPSFIDETKSKATILYECFTNIFKGTNIFHNYDITFEKISLDKNHIFASICKTSDLDVLTEIKSKGIEIEDKSEYVLESYTYFYLDFNNMGASIIKTQKIPSSDTEEVDLIRNIFTKQVSIELNKDYKNDISQIEETLKNELFKIINT